MPIEHRGKTVAGGWGEATGTLPIGDGAGEILPICAGVALPIGQVDLAAGGLGGPRG